MEITERQQKILNHIVQEHIDSAHPIASQYIQKKHLFNISPATVRNEMKALTDNNYVYQCHASGGRIPTDKGYRFFVDQLLKQDNVVDMHDFHSRLLKKDDIFDLIRLTTDFLADCSCTFTLGYYNKFLWEQGWEKAVEEPEFENTYFLKRFVSSAHNLAQNIEDFEGQDFKIYIGQENPLLEAKEFTLMISEIDFPFKKNALFAIFGPKRMGYERNICLLNSLKRLIENE